MRRGEVRCAVRGQSRSPASVSHRRSLHACTLPIWQYFFDPNTPGTAGQDSGRQEYGCYAFGITLEKVDLDLRGAHRGQIYFILCDSDPEDE